MSNFCYVDSFQISKKVKSSTHVYPVYGESRTDPTFYEPTATRIANMRKSASSGVALYDYDGSQFADIANNSKLTKEQKLAEYAKRLDISTKNHFVEPAREVGITREELSQIQNETAMKIDDKIVQAKEEKQNTIDKQREIADMAKVAKSAISDDSANAK